MSSRSSKSRDQHKNVRPAREVCEKCSDHGICIAETGANEYMCSKIMHPDLYDAAGKLK